MEVCGQLNAPAAFREAVASWKEKLFRPCRESNLGSSILSPTNCTGKMLLSYNSVVYLSNQTAVIWFTALSDWNMRKVILCQSSQSVENLRCSKETVLMADFGIWEVSPPLLSVSLSDTHTQSQNQCDGLTVPTPTAD